MSFQIDDSIREDYLNEAGEIVEDLGERLVELERHPTDKALLDKVFRAFHTVKGGAGFLDVQCLVELCHCAEEVFDALRGGRLELRTEIMDSVLHALDEVTAMLAALREGRSPDPAPPALIDQLRAFAHDEAGGASEHSPAEPSAGDVTDEDFEAMVAELAEAPATEAPADTEAEEGGSEPARAEAEITDEEFESLLDELHGDGPPGAASDEPASDRPSVDVGASSASAEDDEISDEEFEAILDQVARQHTEQEGSGERTPQPSGPAPEPEPTRDRAAVAEAVEAGHRPTDGAEPSARAPSAPSTTGVRPAGGVDPTIRIDVAKLDHVMNLVGELVLVRNRLSNLGQQLKHEELQSTVANLDLVTSDLQMGVMQTRMQPIGKVFSRFPRLTRDLARSLGKEIELTLHGEETALDKNLVEALSDPLVHLVRNAMDHGIEDPEQRAAAGKPRSGQVELSAEQEGDHIVIRIRDDGAGIDAGVLRRKAIERGLITEDAASRLSRRECFDLMMLPGLSTRDDVSDISGRGVGMDVVKTRIAELNGNIEIDSERGKGTTFKIQVPLTLAILPALMVRLDTRRFAVPLSHVVEVFFLDSDSVREVEGRDVIMVRGKPLPLIFLRNFMGIGTEPAPREGYVVVLQVGSEKIGYVTDDVLGQEEVVIKPLGALLQGLSGFAGATITGDGHIALIIDINGLMKRFGKGRRGG
jgi:two-component system chemotaxis sensor kinase CheA